jgi:hypothetical protein
MLDLHDQVRCISTFQRESKKLYKKYYMRCSELKTKSSGSEEIKLREGIYT